MFNFRTIFVLLLITNFHIVSSITIAIAQTQQQPTPQTRRKEPKSIWETIWNLLTAREQRNMASRGNLCPITGLLEKQNVIWSDRPLFLWQGTGIIEIKVYAPFDPNTDEKLLWSQKVKTEDKTNPFNGIPYNGEQLQSGKSYDWELIYLDEKGRQETTNKLTFQVMKSPERDRISAELNTLQTQLQAEGATTEEIALQRANYFAERDLWSDALQEIYSVPNPSPDLINNYNNLLTSVCKSE
ncbi:MAG: DUF928 domain-containing protein [Hydrococcus sp. Prado102]|jgi:hypothetical protein|nr:DUF928 domain-containing protein [Hydrococcus sp. Prado102]